MKTVTAAVILRGSEVLLTRRAPDQKLAGHWEFPGGKLESGETLSECLERELAEELGLRVTVTDVLVSSVYRYANDS